MTQIEEIFAINAPSGYSDYFNAISGFTTNSRAQGGPVTIIVVEGDSGQYFDISE